MSTCVYCGKTFRRKEQDDRYADVCPARACQRAHLNQKSKACRALHRKNATLRPENAMVVVSDPSGCFVRGAECVSESLEEK